jgi:hypothetical protein
VPVMASRRVRDRVADRVALVRQEQVGARGLSWEERCIYSFRLGMRHRSTRIYVREDWSACA